MEMKKNRTEQQKDRVAIFDLAKGLTTIIVVGATLGALYEAPWELYFKVIVFGFMFLLGLIANELSRNGNAAHQKYFVVSGFPLNSFILYIYKYYFK